MTFDSRAFRNALGRFATGVAVMTASAGDGRAVGVTINSFSSVSLDPPLVLFCLGRTSQAFDVFAGAECFAVNILAEDQQELSVRFSSRTEADRWDGVAVERGETGCPLLQGCLANLECTREAVHEGGDHVILVGRVRRLAYRDEGRPLLYYAGRYARLGE